MALFPCSSCGQRYAGKQQTIYAHLVEQGTDLNTRLRLCPRDFDIIYEFLVTKTYCTAIGNQSTDFYQEGAQPTCLYCDEVTGGAMLYSDAYPMDNERRTFYGRVCHNHVPQALDMLKMTT